MAKQIINIGSEPNDGTGDPLRTAFTKVNQNFTEIYDFANNTTFSSITLTDYHEPTNNIISFVRPANSNLVDSIDTSLSIARSNNIGGIYNSAVENEWDETVSPKFTLWNWSGWSNIQNVTRRQYRTFKESLKNRIGNNIIGAELVMYDVQNNKYYKVKFSEWSQGSEGHTGAFSYTRELIDTSLQTGVTFPDGSSQFTAVDAVRDWFFVDLHDVNYTITIRDINRILYSFDNTIYIPRDSDLNLPVGVTINIFSGVVGVNIERVQHIGEEEAEIFVSGFSNALGSWQLPPRSGAILTKVDTNKWYLTVTNSYTDLSQFTDTTNKYISVNQLKSIVANSATYTDFQNAIDSL
jgi:hypothetical protein